MSDAKESALSFEELEAAGPSPRLGYLLKQAHLQFVARAAEALAPLKIGAREWAALLCFDDERGLSQGEVGQQLGIDRTTMVALVDDLQEKSLVERVQDVADRRKNRVQLTTSGRSVMQRGAQAADELEREFLAVLDDGDATRLKVLLQALIAPRC